jgi:electron transport complex protein RnfC
MIKRSFFGVAKPVLKYNEDVPGVIQELPTPQKVVLLLNNGSSNGGVSSIKVGDAVKTGQVLSGSADSDDYVISTVTGTISALSFFDGTFGEKFTAITIDASNQDEWDDTFKKDANLDMVSRFFEHAPGSPSFKAFQDPEKNIRTIVVYGVDQDLLLTVNQYAVQSEAENIKKGVQALKTLTGVDRIIIAIPENLVQQANATGAEVKTISAIYPSSLPQMVMKDAVGQVVSAGDTLEEAGAVFMSAEAVAALGVAIETGRLRMTKLVTVAGKDGSMTNVQVRIGTPIGEVLKACNISVNDRDRIILGGPMRGVATYSLDLPVEPHTDGIVVQAQVVSALLSDCPCVNCGECVRICPVKIPVNMLIRFLEASFHEEARELYDLDSCIECGLCSYVCETRIPIFHYIKMGKHELRMTEAAEAENE